MRKTTPKGKVVIVASYFAGEHYGLLGPQLAATIIEDHTPYECIVLALTRGDTMDLVKTAIKDYAGAGQLVAGFSTLSGRADLFQLAKALKEEGIFTILGGSQADVDFLGEEGNEMDPGRFPGFHTHFSCAVHGPGEQAIPLLRDLPERINQQTPGLISRQEGRFRRQPALGWDPSYFRHVRWDNIYRVEGSSLQPLQVTTAQVIQQIGCPYAARSKSVAVDYPTALGSGKQVLLSLSGCSFCDVAKDKGFFGTLPLEVVLEQIRGLPENEGVKVPFELVNENPLPGLPLLLREIKHQRLRIRQIDLVTRADWFSRHQESIREALTIARDMGVRIRLASIGFEAFNDRILRNLNKGTTVAINLRAVALMRQLKTAFPRNWAYSRQEGSIHGFIHPTPWDTEETWAGTQQVFDRYGLPQDILPDHSLPLIIHHAGPLGKWARTLEEKEGIKMPRQETIIEWWSLLSNS